MGEDHGLVYYDNGLPIFAEPSIAPAAAHFPSGLDRPRSLLVQLRLAAEALRAELREREAHRPNDPTALQAHEAHGEMLAEAAAVMDSAAAEIAAGIGATPIETDSSFRRAAEMLSQMRRRVDTWVASDAATATLTKRIFAGAGTAALLIVFADTSGNGILSLAVAAAIAGGGPIADSVAKMVRAYRDSINEPRADL